jgi:hypothetical protein
LVAQFVGDQGAGPRIVDLRRIGERAIFGGLQVSLDQPGEAVAVFRRDAREQPFVQLQRGGIAAWNSDVPGVPFSRICPTSGDRK